MSRPISDWADLKYEDAQLEAHVVPFGDYWSLCHRQPNLWWLGTGDMDEIELAAALPLCQECKRLASPGESKPDTDPAVDMWVEAMKEATK